MTQQIATLPLTSTMLRQQLTHSDVQHLIERVEDQSDEIMNRVRVLFKNGYELSIIRGAYSFGGPEGLFEIAPIDRDGALNGDLFDEEHQGDDVLGHCDLECINHYVHKLALLPKEPTA